MEIKKTALSDFSAVRFSAQDEGREVGRVYLYILKNDLHDQPFGFLEDLFVAESHRRHGIGTKLTAAAIEEAKNRNCYKLIFTSRHENEPFLHSFYEKMGFTDWGKEFRMDF